MSLPERFREIVKRPAELLRRVVASRSSGVDEGPLLKLYMPEAMDRTSRATGIEDYGIDVEKKIERSTNWNVYVAKITATEFGTSHGVGSATVRVSPTRARVYYLIPYPVKPHHSAAVYRDVANRLRTQGHEKLAQLLYNLMLEAYTRKESIAGVPFSISVQPVSFERKGDKVDVYFHPDKGKEKGLFVTIALDTNATDEELENQTKKIMERLLQEIDQHLD